MTNTMIQRERQRLFRSLTRQYKAEGYDVKESKRLAKLDVDDIMSDKENFVDNYVREVWEDFDE
ncbi:hypothetical protein [Sneathiella sp.]|jgi:hypothetical protein|uniref:hypothetical protein n=1 Tax=Sneathiella sp. TaxID=1964365 RepID=UPI0025D4C08E|nr:hypothetical protein [Sneathiella sp.]